MAKISILFVCLGNICRSSPRGKLRGDPVV